ncbi:hypothetical protein ACEQ8H_003490 [Pleosporales sp. CAS-2024a]
MQRNLSTSSTTTSPRSDTPLSDPDYSPDIVIIGAGFAGCYALHTLRAAGFSAKVLEAGSNLGGTWHWNSYPGARVDSEWPVYALNIGRIYRQWRWSERYPGHEEIKRYFAFVGAELDLYRDCLFGQTVVEARWEEEEQHQHQGTTGGGKWLVRTDQGLVLKASYVLACTGFAAKRYFPDWKGLDDFKGEMHHSSFWPEAGVHVKGKKVAVVGTGATGVQIIQEWAREVGHEGSLTVFQRTPQLGFPMQQKKITEQEHKDMMERMAEIMETSRRTSGGFAFDSEKTLKTFDHNDEQREQYYESLWTQGGFRFHGMNYSDMLKDDKANDEAYKFWAKKVRARIRDPRKRDLLAPLEKPHLLGGKRPSMEQWYYDVFEQANVDIVDLRTNPIQRVVAEGIQTADGVVHHFDTIALATGFDTVTGGLNAINIQGTQGLLRDKWAKGVWTHLGMTVSSFPNFFMLYGPQAPTAFANGPSAVEPQAEWIVAVLQDMRRQGKHRIEAVAEAEKAWKELVMSSSAETLRHDVPSGWNGGNVPGKVREPLSYAGGLTDYRKRIDEVRQQGMKGFVVT